MPPRPGGRRARGRRRSPRTARASTRRCSRRASPPGWATARLPGPRAPAAAWRCGATVAELTGEPVGRRHGRRVRGAAVLDDGARAGAGVRAARRRGRPAQRARPTPSADARGPGRAGDGAAPVAGRRTGAGRDRVHGGRARARRQGRRRGRVRRRAAGRRPRSRSRWPTAPRGRGRRSWRPRSRRSARSRGRRRTASAGGRATRAAAPRCSGTGGRSARCGRRSAGGRGRRGGGREAVVRAVLQRVTRASVSVDGEVVGGDRPARAARARRCDARRRPGAGRAGRAQDRRPADPARRAVGAGRGCARARRQPVHALRRHPQGPAARPGTRRRPGRSPSRWSTRSSRRCARGGSRSRRGVFGADMAVELVNDGPVTMLLESTPDA